MIGNFVAIFPKLALKRNYTKVIRKPSLEFGISKFKAWSLTLNCWTIMTHSITICTEHGAVVQINYLTKEIALLSFVIGLPRYINDGRSI